LTAASLDISGAIDVDGTTNLDVVDIDGAVDMATTLTLAGNADFNGDLDVDGTTNLDVVDIDGAVDMATTLTLAGNATFNGWISQNVTGDASLLYPGLKRNHYGFQVEDAGTDGSTVFIGRKTGGTTNSCLTIGTNAGSLDSPEAEDSRVIQFIDVDPAGIDNSSPTDTSGVEVGWINISTTDATYNTASDYRLKENEVAISDGISRVKQLSPYRFNFKRTPNKTVDGFFAHETATVVPEAIAGTKDAVNEDGDPKYQGIDQSKLVPLLTAALKEAITKIESLEARVTVLES
jgi:hypothetical protein